MSKPDSYFDWQLTFRKKADQIHKENLKKLPLNARINLNSLGISDNNFREFMKNWKIRNL
ncbi:MAG: hypothetical protein EU532_07930 [Promethearchaeota archaeon]|nr:MAG: hypothetical protein EU532_07930 [Candidatus Lokiarchaeota archaeon]